MSCDILLVNVHAFKGRRYFPQQIMSTSYALKKETSYSAKHFYYVLEWQNMDKLVDCIESLDPRIVVCMTDTMSINEDCLHVPKALKEKFQDKTIITGGYMINNFPDCITDEATADYVWYGDSQICLPGFCKAVLEGEDPTQLPGIYDMKSYLSESKPTPNYAKKLDDVDLDFSIIEDPEQYVLDFEGKRAVWGVKTSVGCPFTCRFCSNSMEKSYYRAFDTAKVYNWLKILKDEWKIVQVMYMDSLFFASEKRALEIIKMNSELGIAMYNVNMRANNMTQEVCQALCEQKSMNEIFFGSEFYDDEILKKINKKITVKDIDNAVEMASRFPHVNFVTNFIFGVPGTTKADLSKALDFMFKTYKTVPNVAIWCCRLYLFPRSRFFKEISEQCPDYINSVSSIIRLNQVFTDDDMPWTKLPKKLTSRISVIRHMTALYMTINRAHWKMTGKTPFWNRMKMHFLRYVYLPTLEFRSKKFLWKFFEFENALVEYMYGNRITSEHNVKSIRG